jgi:predicted hydrolase (HD superfamily)
MANNTAKAESQKANAQAKPVQSPVKAAEPTYTVEEFASAPESVGASADIVTAALLVDGKKSYTVSEAKEIVKKFKEKEVK